MPIYEFRCDKCMKQFEVLKIGFTWNHECLCPYCKEPMKKQISRCSFRMCDAKA